MRNLAYTLGVLLLLICVLVGDASGDIYTWVDRDGQVHFTDDYSLVPPEYRDRAGSRPSSPPSEPLSPPASSGTSKKGKLSKSPPPPLPSTGGLSQVVAVLDGDTIIITGGEKVRYRVHKHRQRNPR